MKGSKKPMHVEAFDTRIRRWRNVSLSKAFGRHLNSSFNLRNKHRPRDLGQLPRIFNMLIACLDFVFFGLEYLSPSWPEIN